MSKRSAPMNYGNPQSIEPPRRPAHGITALVLRQCDLSNGWVSNRRPVDIAKHGVYDGCTFLPGVLVTRKYVVVHQSNGYWLPFDKLSHAMNFCRRQDIPLYVQYQRTLGKPGTGSYRARRRIA